MKSLQDALYNYLTIKVVSDERPEDLPAKETKDLFEKILIDEHSVENIRVIKEEMMYIVHFEKAGETKKTQFPVDLIEVMLNQIQSEPEKFKNYPLD